MREIGLEPDETSKIYSLGAGGYIRKDRSKDFHSMFELHRQELKEMRKIARTIEIKFAGIDEWNRAVFVSIEKPKRYYGSVTKLFNYDAAQDIVLKELFEDDLCYFGDSFGCEPMGTLAGNLKIVK